jgi:hypothetical protein
LKANFNLRKHNNKGKANNTNPLYLRKLPRPKIFKISIPTAINKKLTDEAEDTIINSNTHLHLRQLQEIVDCLLNF